MLNKKIALDSQWRAFCMLNAVFTWKKKRSSIEGADSRQAEYGRKSEIEGKQHEN